MEVVPGKYQLFLMDELPKFGSGMRYVTVATIGRKWVVLTYAGKKTKISQQKWVNLLLVSEARRKKEA